MKRINVKTLVIIVVVVVVVVVYLIAKNNQITGGYGSAGNTQRTGKAVK
jgi:ABC-type cobalt transport system substrate-binding protein